MIDFLILVRAETIDWNHLVIADEWKHETDCTVSQDDSINLVHSKTDSENDQHDFMPKYWLQGLDDWFNTAQNTFVLCWLQN